MELQYGPNKIWMENEAGTVVAEVDFVEREDGNYDIVHTFVDDSLRGQGAAGKLVKAAADEIRRRYTPQIASRLLGGYAPTPTPGSAVTKTNRIYLDNQDENLLDFLYIHDKIKIEIARWWDIGSPLVLVFEEGRVPRVRGLLVI